VNVTIAIYCQYVGGTRAFRDLNRDELELLKKEELSLNKCYSCMAKSLIKEEIPLVFKRFKEYKKRTTSKYGGGHIMKLFKVIVIILTIFIVVGTFPEGYSQTENKASIKVEVNPNLELFAVIYILAFNGSDPFIIAPEDYINDVLTYFAPYKEHEAVKYIRKVLNSSYPYYHRDDMIRELSSRLAMLNYLPNETNLGDLEPLADFANKSNFMKFYNTHRKEYEQRASLLWDYLKCIPDEYKKFFGYTYNSFKVEASYSLRIHPHRIVKNQTMYYIGYMYCKNNVTVFSQTVTILHEFTHPFIEEFLTRNFKLFENTTYYLDEIRNEMSTITIYDPDHYMSLYWYLTELFVEGLAEHLAIKCGVPEDYVLFTNLRMSSTLFPLKNFLHEYQEVENANETLYQYAPTFARHLNEWATPENVSELYRIVTPVVGVHEIDKAAYMDKLIIVYGTQNPDKRGREYDRETAYLVKNNLRNTFTTLYGYSPSIIVKTDKNLTEEDLKHNLILIGGPVANGIVEQLNDKLPVKFIFNGSWSLRRNPSNVKEFAAFYVTPDYVEQISLNRNIPPDVYGVVETIRNPWNGNAYITIIAGIDRYGTRKMISWIGLESYVIKGEKYWEIGFYTQNGGDMQ